jgi:SET family sugar efflux transporter-like MFS transporter
METVTFLMDNQSFYHCSENRTCLSSEGEMKLDFFRGESGSYFLLNGITALSFAFIMPIMTLFLVGELGVEPIFIGVYTMVTAIATMFVSQKLGALSDNGVNSKTLFMLATGAISLAAISFGLANHFWQVLLVGILFMSFGGSAMPVMLAMIRRFAERSGKNSAKINSQMRSSISLLWIVGPALAFSSVDVFGFHANFFIAAAIAATALFLGWRKLPDSIYTVTKKVDSAGKAISFSREVWVLGVIIFFASLANGAYINAIPLYLTQDLHFPMSFPGVLLGLTAAFEIPVMLLAAQFAVRYGTLRLLQYGFLSAIIFYVGIQYAESTWAFISLQLFNGLFFGIFAGLGVTVVQDYAGDGVGKASAFYTNAMSIGMMIGTSVMGGVSQFFGFKVALLVSLFAVVISSGTMHYFEVSQKRKTKLADITSS